MINGIQKDVLCKTTTTNNNCGLNCLTHFLYSKLKNKEAQLIFSENAAYNDLLKTFKEYYGLDSHVSLDDLEKLLDNFPVPMDKETILAPVLRKYVGKILAQQADTLQFEASNAVSEYLNTGKIEGISAPLLNANLTFYKSLKQKYDNKRNEIAKKPFSPQERQEAKNKLLNNGVKADSIDEGKLNSQIEFMRKNAIEDEIQDEANDFWMKTGAKNYGDYIGDLKKATEISCDHLNLICQQLGIGIEVYLENSGIPMLTAKNDNVWIMRLKNNGAHWEFEEPNLDPNKTKEHNNYYSHLNKAQFEVQAYMSDNNKTLVMANVLNILDKSIPILNNLPQPLEIIEEVIFLSIPTPPKPLISEEVIDLPMPKGYAQRAKPQSTSYNTVKSQSNKRDLQEINEEQLKNEQKKPTGP